jgi:hypothetical protein
VIEPADLLVVHAALVFGNVARSNALVELIEGIGRRDRHRDRLADQRRVGDHAVLNDELCIAAEYLNQCPLVAARHVRKQRDDGIGTMLR